MQCTDDLQGFGPKHDLHVGLNDLRFYISNVRFKDSSGNDVDVCDVDPGFEVTATVRTSLRAMTEIWRGDRGWGDGVRSGRVEVEAPTDVARAVPTWIGQSLLSAVPRPA